MGVIIVPSEKQCCGLGREELCKVMFCANHSQEVGNWLRECLGSMFRKVDMEEERNCQVTAKHVLDKSFERVSSMCLSARCLWGKGMMMRITPVFLILTFW